MISPIDILNGKILIADDLQANVILLERILHGAGYTQVSSTLDPASVCALHRANRYDLIVLDLQMPGMSGFEVMDGLKEIEQEGYLPVLVITAQPSHKLRALQAGAKDFVSKPFDLAEVRARVYNILEVRLLQKALQLHNDVLESRVRERTAELKESYLETIFTMTRAAEQHDEDTGAHVKRISHYCRAFAEALGLDRDFQDRIFFASPMHDVGKIGIPDFILRKPGSLTTGEWDVMKGHAGLGAHILRNSMSPYLQMGAEIALNHHERWDGGGYPSGKRGEAIPLLARITHICDIYDALRNKRSYKPAYDHQAAVEIITRGDGRSQPEHFDPVILDAFQRHHESFQDIFESLSAERQLAVA